MPYFLGADVGGTKTHIAIADDGGNIVGFGKSGPGNPQGVGYDGLFSTLQDGVRQALSGAGLTVSQISGAGFGIAGYDWPSALPRMQAVVTPLGLAGPFQIVNDTIPGLVAGAKDGWGISIVSGTGCNCRGWDKEHRREGRVTGYGEIMGEAAGAIELVIRAMHMIGYVWTKRIPPSALSDAFIAYAGAKSLEDLIEGYTEGRYEIGPAAAPLVKKIANTGDHLAVEIIRWAGHQLGEMACGVVRQLEFETLDFDVVMVGSMFKNGEMLIDCMRQTIHCVAPGARLVHLKTPPVLGAVMIGMEQAGLTVTSEIHHRLNESLREVLSNQEQVLGD